MKIAFITQSTKNLVSTRGKLIEKIKEKGHEVIAIIPNKENESEMEISSEKRR